MNKTLNFFSAENASNPKTPELQKSELLCLHGFLGNGRDFDFLKSDPDIQKLHPLAPDFFSAVPSGESLGEEAEKIAHTVLPKTRPFKTTLLGYSYGGRVALELCLKNPAHFSKLVLVSSGFGISGSIARAERAENDEKWAQIFLEKPWDECLKLWSAQEILSSTSDVLGPRNEAQYSRARLAEALRLRGQAHAPFYFPRLGELKIPVLLVVGEFDEKYVRQAEAALPQFSRAQVIKLKGASHRACFQQPGPFLEAFKTFIFS